MSTLEQLRVSRLVEHRYNDDAIIIGMVKQRIRKPMNENPAKCSMNQLEGERSFLRKGNRFAYSPDEVAFQLRRDILVPALCER